MAVFEMTGEIIGNDYEEMYDWFGYEYSSPRKLKEAFDGMTPGDRMQIKINSPGGDVGAGQQIYSMLRGRDDYDIEITGLAASAASLIAMAGPSSISPAGMLMIHNVWANTSGNKNELKKTASVLDEYDHALANAYAEKSGMDVDKVLDLMNKETWLSANRAVELGFVDKITSAVALPTNASLCGMRITEEQINQFKEAKAAEEKRKESILNGLDNYGA